MQVSFNARWNRLILTIYFTIAVLIANSAFFFLFSRVSENGAGILIPKWFILFQGLTVVCMLALMASILALKKLKSQLKENLQQINFMQEQEITKTKEHISTMEDYRKMLIEIIDKIPQKIFLKDKEGKFLLANSSFAIAHHKKVEELIGTSDFDFFSFEIATEYRNKELEIHAAGKPVYFPEEIFKNPNGEDRVLQTTKMPFYINYLNETGILGIQTDITDIKKYVEKEKLAKLEAIRMREVAEKANLAKSTFLATMSHEIRTPMNGVIGMASLLNETTLTSEQQEYTETIRNCGENLLTIINDVLDFSKIESGNMELESTDFDLRTCVEEVLDVFGKKAADVGLDLLYEIDYNVPSIIIGDSVRLRQVILNLVSNAIKFTAKGEVFVGIHLLDSIGQDRVELGFEIRDTGIGIPVDKLERLFKAFSQVDSSTTRKYGGTGLGLVICEKLVALMGGSIQVESHPGKGTIFTFTIHAGVSQESVRTYVHQNIAGLEGKSVLVIDDNLTNRNILKNQLLQWKMLPTLVTSGDDALAILKERCDFDVVLTDMQMPAMDGLELARHIKKNHNGIPIILLSSVGDERSKDYPELFASVLTKPVRQSTLFRHIVAQLSQQPVTAENEMKKQLSVDFAEKYPLNILIAEDNPVNMKLAERILTKLGYVPRKAMNGQEAIDALKKNNVEVILMDIQMPVMDGLEATKMIRFRKGGQPVIIAMTANAMQGDRGICIKAGMDDYISKPLKPEDLVTMLQKWALQLK